MRVLPVTVPVNVLQKMFAVISEKPNSITLASSELAPNMFGASSEIAPNMFGTSSELASVMEFGTN